MDFFISKFNEMSSHKYTKYQKETSPKGQKVKRKEYENERTN